MLFAQQKIKIVDSETQSALPDARIIANNQIYYTNDDGFCLVPDNAIMDISAGGFQSLKAVKVQAVIQLKPLYNAMDEVKIVSIDPTLVLKKVLKTFDKVYYTKPITYNINVNQKVYENNDLMLLMIADGKFWSRDGKFNPKEAFKKNFNNFVQIQVDNLPYLKSKEILGKVKVKDKDAGPDDVGDFFLNFELNRTLSFMQTRSLTTSGRIIFEDEEVQEIAFNMKSDKYSLYFKGKFLYNKADNAITHFELDFKQSDSKPRKLKDEDGKDYESQLGDGLIYFDYYKKDQYYYPARLGVKSEKFKKVLSSGTYEYRTAREFIFKSIADYDSKGLPRPVSLGNYFWKDLKVSTDKGDVLLSKEEEAFINEATSNKKD